MMREDDHFIELDDRVRFANRQGPGAVLVSIHYDAVSNHSMHGAKTFYWRADSHGLATRIQQQLVTATDETDQGVMRRRLRLTRNPEIPCVLCECAYLTNPAEAQKVATDSYRRRIAHGIAQGNKTLLNRQFLFRFDLPELGRACGSAPRARPRICRSLRVLPSCKVSRGFAVSPDRGHDAGSFPFQNGRRRLLKW